MIPLNALTVDDLNYWRPSSTNPPEPMVFTAPDDPEDAEPCAAIVTTDPAGRTVIRVKWQPTRAEALTLVDGGCIWLSAWHALPAHMLEVAAPAGVERPSVLPEQVADLLPEWVLVDLAAEHGGGLRAYVARGHWPVWLVEGAVLARVAADSGLGRAEALRAGGLCIEAVWAQPIETAPGELSAGIRWIDEPADGFVAATIVTPA